MYEYDEDKAREIRDAIESALIEYIEDGNLEQLVVSDLKTDEDGDVYIRVDIKYCKEDSKVGEYYIWNCYRGGWCDPIDLMARVMRDTLKDMEGIYDWVWN